MMGEESEETEVSISTGTQTSPHEPPQDLGQGQDQEREQEQEQERHMPPVAQAEATTPLSPVTLAPAAPTTTEANHHQPMEVDVQATAQDTANHKDTTQDCGER